MQSQLEMIKQEIEHIEKLQSKLDEKMKDTAAYKESNAQLTSIVRTCVVSIVIIVIVFSATILYTMTNSQQCLHNKVNKAIITDIVDSDI